jgi:undecaprenyl-diphosphatase
MDNVNIELFRFINNLGKEFQFLNPIMIFIAEYVIYGLAGFMILLWLSGKDKVKNRVMLSCCMISFIGAEVIGKTLGNIYYHNQPFAMLNSVNKLVLHEIDNSFPSDHSILIFSICSMLYLFNRNKKGIFAMFNITKALVDRYNTVELDLLQSVGLAKK